MLYFPFFHQFMTEKYYKPKHTELVHAGSKLPLRAQLFNKPIQKLDWGLKESIYPLEQFSTLRQRKSEVTNKIVGGKECSNGD